MEGCRCGGINAATVETVCSVGEVELRGFLVGNKIKINKHIKVLAIIYWKIL